MTMGAVLALALVLSVLAAAGCGQASYAGVTGKNKLALSGSTTVLPIAQEAADEFMAANKGITVNVQGGGSSVGITNVNEGVVDIGDSSRDLKDAETSMGLVDNKIAYDIVKVVVNPNVKVTDLTMDQIKNIFLGKITNWSQVGGPNQNITVVIRDSASGTRELFDQKVLGSTTAAPVTPVKGATETNSSGVMRQKVASTPGGIGYISSGYVDNTVTGLKIGGVQGDVDNAISGKYVLARWLHMFTRGQPNAISKKYIDFVLSPAFQNGPLAKDFIPVSKVPAGTGTSSAAK
jgi:phosphate transport system substrate-binding protein